MFAERSFPRFMVAAKKFHNLFIEVPLARLITHKYCKLCENWKSCFEKYLFQHHEQNSVENCDSFEEGKTKAGQKKDSLQQNLVKKTMIVFSQLRQKQCRFLYFLKCNTSFHLVRHAQQAEKAVLKIISVKRTSRIQSKKL